MFIHLNKKAQSTAEYVIVLGLIVAAVVAMQTYVKRGFQAKIKDAVDYNDPTNNTYAIFSTSQYEPGYLSSNFKSTRDSTQADGMVQDGGVTRTLNQEYSSRQGSMTTLAPESEE